VGGHRVRDATQQLHGHRCALTARADHDEERIAGRLGEHRRRVAPHDLALDIEIGMLLLQLREYLVEAFLGTRVVLLQEVAPARHCLERVSATRQRHLGDHIQHEKWDSAYLGPFSSPINSLVRSLRAIGSHNNPTCGLKLCGHHGLLWSPKHHLQ